MPEDGEVSDPGGGCRVTAASSSPGEWGGGRASTGFVVWARYRGVVMLVPAGAAAPLENLTPGIR